MVVKKTLRQINALLKNLGTERRVTEESLDITLTASTVVILKKDTRIIGMASLCPIYQLGKKYALINDFVIAQSFQRKGYGVALLEEVKRVAKKDFGISLLHLHTSRKPASLFYQQNGFLKRKGSQVLTCEI